MRKKDSRLLKDLESVGKETLKDFQRLEISSVEQLSKQDPRRLYDQLGELSGAAHDICVLDVMVCAVAQAKNPNLPEAQRKWWYWSRKRKASQKK